jgi:ABC-2 type transport system ATP-binding protein
MTASTYPPAAVDAAVLADGLERSFGDNQAVDRIDLRVKPGEIYGFL